MTESTDPNVNPNQTPPTDPPPADPPPADPTKNTGGSTFYKEKLARIEQENEELKNKLDQEKTTKLKEKEDYKQLYEHEKGKREEAESKTDNLKNTLNKYFKTSSIKTAAIKAGIRDDAVDDLDLLDNSMVEIETTSSGNVNVLGSKEFIESLKKKKPFWFSDSKPPKLNNGPPSDPKDPKTLTSKDIIALQKKDPKKYAEIMKKRIAGKISIVK